MIPDYEHYTQYYETDQMGCVHHSNYIRWMEEARVFLMEQMGCSYRAMEEAGILSPVLEVSCKVRANGPFWRNSPNPHLNPGIQRHPFKAGI